MKNSPKAAQHAKIEELPLSTYSNGQDDSGQKEDKHRPSSFYNPKKPFICSPSGSKPPSLQSPSKKPSKSPSTKNYQHTLEEVENYYRISSSVLSEVISDEGDKSTFGFLLLIIVIFYLEQAITKEFTKISEFLLVALLVILSCVQFFMHKSERFRFLHIIQCVNCLAVLFVMCFWVYYNLEKREEDITFAFTLALKGDPGGLIGKQQVISSIRQEAKCFLQGAIVFRLQECLSKHLFPMYRLGVNLISAVSLAAIFFAKQIQVQDGITADIFIKGIFFLGLLIFSEYSMLKLLISYVISFSALKKYYTLSQCSSSSSTHGLCSNTLQIEINPNNLSECKVIQGNSELSQLLLTDSEMFFKEFEIDPLTIECFDPASSNELLSHASSTSLEKDKTNNNNNNSYFPPASSSRPLNELNKSNIQESRSTSRRFIDLKILKQTNIQDNPLSSVFKNIKNGQKSEIPEKRISVEDEEEFRNKTNKNQVDKEQSNFGDSKESFSNLTSIVKDCNIKSVHLRGKFQTGETDTKTFKYLSITIQKYTNLFQRTVVIASIADVTAIEDISNLQKEVKFKEKMFANVTHDLRTPLYVIMFSAEKLKEIFSMNTYNTIQEQRANLAANLKDIDNDSIGVLHDSINTMLANSHLMKCIIQDIIDDNRNRMGQLELEVNSFDLMEVLSEMKKLTEVLLWEKRNNIEIHFDVSKEVEKNSNIFTDQQRLKQVLMNLITNAIKFTKKGGIVVKVNKVKFGDLGNLERYLNQSSINAIKHQSFDFVKDELVKFGLIQFQVIDSGIGMTPLVRKSLFTPYKTFNNENLNRHGIGLGLTICQSIVEKMGPFHLKVASKEQMGSKFTFYIYNNLEQMMMAMKNDFTNQIPLNKQSAKIKPEEAMPTPVNSISHKNPEEDGVLGRSDCNLMEADKSMLNQLCDNRDNNKVNCDRNRNSNRSIISDEKLHQAASCDLDQWKKLRKRQDQQQQQQNQEEEINQSQQNEGSIVLIDQQYETNKLQARDLKALSIEEETYQEHKKTTDCTNMKRMSSNHIQLTDFPYECQKEPISNRQINQHINGNNKNNVINSAPNELFQREDFLDDNSNGVFCETDNKCGKINNRTDNQVAYTINYAPIKRHQLPSHFKSLAVLPVPPTPINRAPELNVNHSQTIFPFEDKSDISLDNPTIKHNNNNTNRFVGYGNAVDSISLIDQQIISFAHNFKDKFTKESQIVDANRLQEDEIFDSEMLFSLENNQERTPEEGITLVYMSPFSEMPRPNTTDIQVPFKPQTLSQVSQVKLKKSGLDSGGSGLILSTQDRQNHVTNYKMTDSVQLNQIKKFKFGVTQYISQDNPQQQQQQQLQEGEIHRLNILICDDNPFNITMLKTYLQQLKKYDLKIDSCLGGEDAIVKFQQRNKPNSLQPYNYIFLDWNMPIMDGYETSSRIKFYVKDEQYLDCPIIICSAYDDNVEINKCLRHGTDAILPKPVSIEKLRDLLNDFQENQTLQKSTLPKMQSAHFPYHTLQVSNIQRF